MTEIDYKYRSEKLKRDVSLKILIPQDFNPKTCKIIYLLHGYLEDNSCWIEKGLAKEVSENKNIAMIMPSLENSFAINYIDGFDYFSYLAYELLDEVLFRFSWDKKSLGQDP